MGCPLVDGAGYFGGGTNAGPIPSTPAVQSTYTPPGSGFVAQDEFFSLAQQMTAATTAAKNIRWDNIYTVNNTASADNARFDNISSYGINSALGTVANGTTLRADGQPWMDGTADAGGSDPSEWKIETSRNSTVGVSGLNAVNDFFVY